MLYEVWCKISIGIDIWEFISCIPTCLRFFLGGTFVFPKTIGGNSTPKFIQVSLPKKLSRKFTTKTEVLSTSAAT